MWRRLKKLVIRNVSLLPWSFEGSFMELQHLELHFTQRANTIVQGMDFTLLLDL